MHAMVGTSSLAAALRRVGMPVLPLCRQEAHLHGTRPNNAALSRRFPTPPIMLGRPAHCKPAIDLAENDELPSYGRGRSLAPPTYRQMDGLVLTRHAVAVAAIAALFGSASLVQA